MRLIFTFLLFLLFFAFSGLLAQTSKKNSEKNVPKTNNIVKPSPKKANTKSNIILQKKITLSSNTKSLNNALAKKVAKLKGIWRGYFIQNDTDPFTGMVYTSKYRYEIQINALPNAALEGVTYSYQDTRFYGKASLKGIYTDATNNVVIKELKMLELKMSGSSEACLMTCYLDYGKNGNKETLRGDYASVNIKDKRKDCGDGIVYLEKVPESEFVKEDFLLPKKNEIKPKIITKKDETSNKQLTVKKIVDTAKKTKPKIKPGAEAALVKKTTPAATTKTEEKVVKVVPDIVKKGDPQKIENKKEVTPIPKVISERKNDLTKTIFVSEGEIIVELYDNGQIDNDTVSVYHNNQPILLHQMLSTKPLRMKFFVNANDPVHEVIMVAENLGKVPPNTSLMVVTVGKKTYEVSITSDLQKNAKVVFEYRADADARKK